MARACFCFSELRQTRRRRQVNICHLLWLPSCSERTFDTGCVQACLASPNTLPSRTSEERKVSVFVRIRTKRDAAAEGRRGASVAAEDSKVSEQSGRLVVPRLESFSPREHDGEH